MTRKTPTVAQNEAAEEAQLLELRLEMEMRALHRKELLIPPGWRDEAKRPRSPERRKVTLRLDADVLKWFRAQGPDYTNRINRVLRYFMLNVVSGETTGEWERDWGGQLQKRG